MIRTFKEWEGTIQTEVITIAKALRLRLTENYILLFNSNYLCNHNK